MLAPLFYAHSGVRYLVLLSAVVAMVFLVVGAAKRRPLDDTSRIIMGAFTGLLDLQVLLGMLLLTAVPFYGALAGHIVMMLLAAVVAHAFVIVNRKRPKERQSHAFLLVGVLLTLTCVGLGVVAIGRPIFGSGGLQ